LLTISGPAGIGKTRLANELARSVAGSDRPTAFLRLSPLRDSAVLNGLIGSVVAIDGWPDLPFAHFNERLDEVLVFDGFDHMHDAGSTVLALLERCPEVVAIVTSREALHLPGEVELPLGPLSMAAPPIQLDDATALLLERLGVQLDDTVELAGLSARSGGNPLAIELIAAHVKMGQEIAPSERMGKPWSLTELVRSCIAELPDDSRKLLLRLSVMAGGFDAKAAGALAHAAPAIAGETAHHVDLLTQLGLIAASTIDLGPLRFHLPTAVREVALAELNDSGELSAIRLAYARHMLERATGFRELLVGRWRDSALAWFELEQSSLRLALGTFIQMRRSFQARKLVQALWPYFLLRRNYRMGRRWLKLALEQFDPANPDELEQELLVASGLLELYSGNRAAARARSTTSARPSLESGQDEWRGASLATLGLLASLRGEHQRAIGLYRIFLESSDRRTSASAWLPLLSMLTQLALSSAYFARGETEDAEYHATGTLTKALHQGDPLFVAYARLNLAAIATAKREWLEALELYRDGTSLLLDRPHAGALSVGLSGLANLAIQIGAYSVAGRLLQLARWLAEAGTPPPPHLIGFDLDHLAALLQQLPRKQIPKMAPDIVVDGMTDVEQIFDQSFAELVAHLLPPPLPSAKRPKHPLTSRELEVVCLAAKDMTDQEIADALFIAYRTATDHMSNVLGKLGVNSRGGAVAIAIREEWCD
jgi:ATP/maltotriose-dependent transcriptional regulator MalT